MNTKHHKTSLLQRLPVGRMILIGEAAIYSDEFGWEDHAEWYYNIEQANKKEIIAKGVVFTNETISITPHDLESGRVYIRF